MREKAPRPQQVRTVKSDTLLNQLATPPASFEVVLRRLDIAGEKAATHRSVIAQELELAIRAIGIYKPHSYASGDRLAKRVNDLVSAFGLRLKMPDSGGAATLAFKAAGNMHPGLFYLCGKVDGAPTTRSIHFDFSTLEVIDAPRDLRRRRLKH